jgi:cytochrome d ubiquinol oxidase subunit II
VPLELLAGGAIIVALVLYLLFGGADFGGGVWDLLAWGPHRHDQRALVEQAIGPIWEANHVWLILAVVVLFTAFPAAFATVSIALHVPLALLLLGIVFRGAAFAFRSFDPSLRGGPWGVAFSVASLLAPLLLGVVVGAVASGRLREDDFLSSWMAAFPLAVGVLTVALCAFLAAVYLTHEATRHDQPALADDFRRRALLAGAATAVLGVLALVLARAGAPRIFQALTRILVIVGPLVLALAAATAWALARRRFRWARLFAAGVASLIVLGWAAAQYPYLIVDTINLHHAAAPPRTLRLLLMALVAGVPVLFPSLYLLFRIFKPASSG